MQIILMLQILLVSYAEPSRPLTTSKSAALILARGGSKGIKLKNIQTIGEVSLLSRSIQTARLAGLDDVTVSTDHPLIALETLRSGAAVFRRSSVTSTDWAPSIWGAAEFLHNRRDVEILVLVQTTSPFMKARSLRDAVKKIKHPKPVDCVFSVTRSFKLRWREENGVLYPRNFELYARPRRQDWDGELLETGAFYIARRHLILMGSFQNNNCTVVEVDAKDSLEVDSLHDLRVANTLLLNDLA